MEDFISLIKISSHMVRSRMDSSMNQQQYGGQEQYGGQQHDEQQYGGQEQYQEQPGCSDQGGYSNRQMDQDLDRLRAMLHSQREG
jgi:hypothetical protein